MTPRRKRELELAISSARPWAAHGVVDAVLPLIEALASARRKLELCDLSPGDRRARSESSLPTAERSRLPTPSAASLSASTSVPQEPPSGGGGRVVMNHSTHVEGLVPVLRRLEKDQFVKTVIPGPLRKGNSKLESFELRLQRDDSCGRGGHGGRGGRGDQGGRGGRGGVFAVKIKLVARKGHMAQDVAIVFNAGLQLSAHEVQEMIDRNVTPPRAESSTSEELPGEGRLNASGAEMREQAHDSATAQHK